MPKTRSRDIVDPKDKSKILKIVQDSNYTYNHGISDCEIKTSLIALLDDPNVSVEDKAKAIEPHLNKEHIKSTIMETREFKNKDGTVEQKNLLEKFDHGAVIRTSFIWSPYNLFYGPGGEYRADDPGNEHDMKILENQFLKNPLYKEAYNEYLKAASAAKAEKETAARGEKIAAQTNSFSDLPEMITLRLRIR